jgi:hypothetical protein
MFSYLCVLGHSHFVELRPLHQKCHPDWGQRRFGEVGEIHAEVSDDEISWISFRNSRRISGHILNPSAGSPC